MGGAVGVVRLGGFLKVRLERKGRREGDSGYAVRNGEVGSAGHATRHNRL